MMVLRKIKENLFLFALVIIYALMFLINPSMGLASIKNSGYYIREMIMIMPVIFVLTALLDTYVQKEKIMNLLGEDAKLKGAFLAFVVGSISAGPIYAAFPMCVMLHKKGASIRNIIIILSSWAVIKIPMLINEAKFLGPKFMVIRWILTLIAIMIFSQISSKILSDEDLPDNELLDKGIKVNRNACMGCSLCVETYPEVFEMENKKALVKEYEDLSIDEERLEKAMDDCPVNAITNA